ncbi:MAG: hypothetical protein DI539_16205 [Flavobacterium psychrophilum]|nr:MAG: hypothetical protein DI539_16205 [Flavobacterium psychrophilum]
MRLLLFFLFYTLHSIAQDQEAKLFFKDGTTVSGYGEIKTKGFLNTKIAPKILFRFSKDEKADEWDYEMVDKIEFYGFEMYKTFTYVKVGDDNNIEYRLLELITEGKVNLYLEKNEYSGSNNIQQPGSYQKWETTTYMVKKESESKLTVLGANKKKIAEYFKDCSGIKKKLDRNEFSIKNIKDIVEYYNDYCSDGNYIDTEE